MRNSRLLGAILLIAGTSIGAGMLATPITTAKYGFGVACLLFFVCWLFMTLASLLMLEVNLLLGDDTNIVSMAKATLGRAGQVIAWIAYLLLLYALMTAYILTIGNLLVVGVKNFLHISTPAWAAILGLVAFISLLTFMGTKAVDWLNRSLMIGLVSMFCILVIALFSHIEPARLLPMHFYSAWMSLPVLLTTFGYQIIIPSLRTYLQSDAKKLQRAIVIGGLIPFCIYGLWEAIILGVIPLSGSHGLLSILVSGKAILGLTAALHQTIHGAWLFLTMQLFIFFIIMTSLMGVSLSLFDFLMDGFSAKRIPCGRVFTLSMAFIPPTLFVLFYPSGFIRLLGYGGIIVAVLLVLMPAIMAFSERYIKKNNNAKAYRAPGGLLSLLGVLIFAVLVILIEIIPILY